MILRRYHKRNAIHGLLTCGNDTFHTLERPVCGLEANKGLSLPEGTYYCELTQSKRFGKSILIYSDEVPKDRRILIHRGNTINDSKGCILVGLGCSLNNNSLIESRKAESQLLDSFERNSITTLKIIDIL